MKGLLQRVFRIGKSNPPIDYEESKRLLAGSSADRCMVAANNQVRPEVLYYLATDPDSAVRRAVAGNEATPVQADLVLAVDTDERVRANLAGKIATLSPGLTARETDRLRRMTYDVLETLIQDQAVRVRRIVSDTLKSMPDAPAEVVQRLARDAELSVSGPVLQYSPVLSDADLINILSQMPIPGASAAIARRKGLSAAVTDVVGNGNDVDAITALLSNDSAQIREETLDRLIDRAPNYVAWHRPLVERPRLSDDAARKLARFVAQDLIQRLRARTDLKPETVHELQSLVLGRLDQDDADDPDGAAAQGGDPMEKLLEEARRLKAAGKLDEDALVDALIGARTLMVHAGLAVLSGLAIAVVDKILASHSAKGVTSLVWRAGLPMRFAVRLQTVLARIPPTQVMKPRSDGGFPLSEEAMTWQIGFFADMAGE